jgi:hypothetical protein
MLHVGEYSLSWAESTTRVKKIPPAPISAVATTAADAIRLMFMFMFSLLCETGKRLRLTL